MNFFEEIANLIGFVFILFFSIACFIVCVDTFLKGQYLQFLLYSAIEIVLIFVWMEAIKRAKEKIKNNNNQNEKENENGNNG